MKYETPSQVVSAFPPPAATLEQISRAEGATTMSCRQHQRSKLRYYYEHTVFNANIVPGPFPFEFHHLVPVSDQIDKCVWLAIHTVPHGFTGTM